MKNYLVIGFLPDDTTYVEHVDAETAKEAAIKVMTNPDNAGLSIVDVVTGHYVESCGPLWVAHTPEQYGHPTQAESQH